ncbi:ead/Ea22-like family protein [Citrobacter braakii]|uniref:ead/Ea22-like family protein n=1 Tax=Citrobacter braakii TaxID=57706 RepID=UPI00066534DD|nr:ead/Ea22-like family protein [Citrobacter braakii]
MSKIDKQALRELIREAGNRKIIVHAKTVSDLLDELEAYEKTSEARKHGLIRAHKMFQRERDRAEAAEKRIAELEARTVSVKLPVVPSQYETLKLCLEPSDGYGMQKGAEYMRDEFIKALTAAGIGVKGE